MGGCLDELNDRRIDCMSEWNGEQRKEEWLMDGFMSVCMTVCVIVG